jgi:deoxyribodipyrimidine photo-lyase
MFQYDKSLVWFRRDLRVFDHAALHHALKQSQLVFCTFIFDTDILANLPSYDRRVEFIHASVLELNTALRKLGGALIVQHAPAVTALPSIAEKLGVDAVFINHDYEPQALARDNTVSLSLRRAGRKLISFKDQVIFEKDEVLSNAGRPFSIFTPYKNAWLKKLAFESPDGGNPYLQPYPIEPYATSLAPPDSTMPKIPSLSELGFEKTNLAQLQIGHGMTGAQTLFDDFTDRLPRYDTARDFPAIKGPSYLSTHLRFGTLSIRSVVRFAVESIRTGAGNGAAVWLSELIWRDFYFMILHHHPHVVEKAFKPEYDRILWETGDRAEANFAAWCEGRTGYPIVDAAMAQLNQTGYMHNRLRMITACFLVKDLGIDWRRGERYFAEKLIDFELASNNGNWQWASSSGCDAQPYFRIFNPVTQSEKFDAQGKFIRRYLPQLNGLSDKQIHAPWKANKADLAKADIELGKHYPMPVVQHDDARKRTLARYAVVKKPSVSDS